MSREIAEIAYDLHSGLASQQVPEFDDLARIGMAATLAIHIKGLGEIEYDVLRKVSDHYMGIQSVVLRDILRILSDIGFVRLIENGKKIEKIIPNIPIYDDVYEVIGSFASSECALNLHEQATLQILTELQKSPQNKDKLRNILGIESPLFARCVDVGAASGILSEYKARGRPVLISPFYFSDNLEGLADAAASAGASAIQSTISKLKSGQGWPLSLINSRQEIAGHPLNATELALVNKLSEEGIIKPPTIKFGLASESFVFTPKPGKTRLNAANREIYERAMALISTVRKGQLLPAKYEIRSPLRILEALRDRGYLRSNSEAREQYANLVVMRVATLKAVGFGWQLHLHKTPENNAALDLAINLLRSGSMAGMEVNEEARIALTKGEEYVQSLISASELKRRPKQLLDQQASHEFEQLILRFE